ncbi:unnamed protein product [Closterium sp. NIES-53]
MYAAVNTRPDVAFATGQLARVVQCPNKEQVAAGMRVAKYLGQTPTVGLQYSAAAQRRQKGADGGESGRLFLTAFSYASFASEPEDMTTVGGFICCVGGGPTAWESKKQVDQALSSVESEYMALFRAVREIVWQRRLLAELGEEQQGPTPLYCDSQGAIALAKNPVLHGLTKHMRVKWHWTRSMVAAGEVELYYVKTTGQPADMMTKRLVEQQHWKCCNGPVTTQQLCSRAAQQLSRPTVEQPSHPATEPPESQAAQQPSRPPAEPPSSRAAQPPSRPTAEPPSSRAAKPPCGRVATAPPGVPWPYLLGLGRAVDFEVWVDDLQLFLQCNMADGLSLFDLTSGASPAPPATADSTVRSQWATCDVAARLAVLARYSSPATAALSRLMLLYLFPDLAAFPTLADLITHLRTSDTRYRAALPAEDQFLSVCPTIDLLEQHLLAAETSIVAVGASRGDPRTPVFEGCSPSLLLPTVASAAVADLNGFESVGAAFAPSGRRRTGRGKGGKGTGGGGGGGGSSSGGGGGGGGGGGSGGGRGGGGGGGSGGAGRGSTQRSASGGGQRQQQQRSRETPSPQQLREWYAGRQRGGGSGPCTYVLRTSDRAGEQCGGLHSTQRCFGRLTDAWRHQFPDATEIPRWGDLFRAGVAIFDLDYDAILAAMYAVSTSDEGDCYLCLPPDPGGEAAALGACEAAALGASASAAPGVGESALSGTTSAQVFHTFTLDSGAFRSFFRDRTTLTPLSRPVAVSLVDPSGGPVLASFSTVLPCPAAPSGTLSGLYLPSFSTNLVSGADLQDQGVDQLTPASQRVTHCTCARTGRHLATFTRRPGSSLYTLSTESPPVPASGQVAASSQVFAAASGSGPKSAPCSCRLLSHQTLLWHHRLGHPSLPRLRGMASRVLVSGLPRSLPPLPPGPAPTCVPCVEGQQRTAPHSSEFPLTEAPLQTLHMDVWGPARVRGQGHERYFLLVVDDYSRYTMMFPLRSKGDVTEVLIDWIREARLQLRESFGSDLPVLRLHSDRGGQFSSARLGAFCRAQGIRQTFTLPASPQQNGIAERRIGMPRVSLPETSPTLRWTGKVGDASAFRVWGSRAFVRDLCADKLSPHAVPCVFLSFPPDAPGWHFYHPTSRHVLSSQDVTFDKSVPYYRLFPYRTAPLPPPPLFLAPGPPPVDPLPPQGPAPSGVSQVDAVEPVEVAVDSGAARGAEPVGAGSRGAESGGAEPGGAESGGAEPGGAEPGGAESGGAEPGDAEPGDAESARVASRSASSRRELLSPQELREWFARRWSRAAGAGGPPVATGLGGARTCGTKAVGTGGSAAATGVGPAGASGAAGAGATGGVGARVGAAGASGAAGGQSAFICPPSVGGECALSMDTLEDRQEEFQYFDASLPHLVSTLIAPEGDPDAPDIPTPRSYAEAIEGPYSSQLQSAMDAEMASWKSTGTYVDEVPQPGANIVSGMWIFRGVDYFHTFSPTPKMTTLRVLLHVAAQRNYELHSLDFSTAFLQGSLHEEIWMHRPPGFTGSFPPGTQWSLRRPVYGLRQAPHEWHDTLRTTLAALGFAPSTADPSLFLRTDTSLLPFYILVYVDDLVFATADTAGLAHVKSELQKRHTCTDLGELRSYLGLQITRDRAQRTITLTQSHMVQQVLQRFDFTYSSPQATPLSTRHSLSALPLDESVEPSGPYPELVGCLMYLMTCTQPDLAYPLSILARYVAPGRHRPKHMAAAKRVLRYLCSTSCLGLVLGGRRPGYTFSLGSGSFSWWSTRSSSVLGSSCEAEIYAGAMAAQELRWLTYLLTDLGEPPRSPPVLYVDNKAMLALSREHRLEHRTKHIALCYFLARELQQRGQLHLAYVASEANTADIFTKALPPGDHQRFCTMLACFALLDWSWTAWGNPYLVVMPDIMHQVDLGIMSHIVAVVRKMKKRCVKQMDRARGARVVEGTAAAAAEAVEEAGGVAVEVGVVPGVGATVAAVGVLEAAVEVVEAAAAVVAVAVAVVLQLREWYAGRGRSGSAGPCTYVLRTGCRRGEACGLPHTTQRCFGRLTDAWRAQFPNAAELLCWGDLLRQNVPIFDLDFDAILAAMYALTDIAEGYCYLSVPPDPGIVAAALGASASAALGIGESVAPGTGESTLSGTAPTEALHRFTLNSGASRSFFRDSTTLTPLSRPVAVSLADPSGGPVLAHSSTVLLCPAAPSGLLSGLHLPSFSTDLVSGADLQDAWVLIDWIRGARCQLSESFGSDLPVLRLHYDRGGEFSSDLLRAFFRAEGIRQMFTLPTSPQQNGIAERRIGMVMDVARTSMVHAAAPHFLWRFALQYAAHQINLQPQASLPETTPTLRWTGNVGDASAFRVWGSRDFVRDTSADKLSSRADPAEPDEVAVDSGAARGDEPAGAGTRGAGTGGAEPERVESGGAESGGAESGRAEPGGAEPGRVEPEDTASAGAEPACVESGGALGVPSRREPLSPQQLREWYSRRCRGAACAGAAGAARGAAGAAGGAARATGAGGAAGAGAAGTAGGAAGAAGGAAGAGAAGAAGGAARAAGGAARAGGASGAGATETAGGAAGAGAAGVSGDASRRRSYYVPLLQQVLGSPPSPGPPSPFLSPPPDQSQSQLQLASPLPGPSPYSGPTRGLTERREPESRPVSPESRSASPVRTVRAGRVSRSRPPPVPGTLSMTLRPSTAPQRVPLPSPLASSLLACPDPASDSLLAASLAVTRFLATAVTNPLFESTAASALVTELVDFAAPFRLDFATSLEEFECFAATVPHLVSMLLAPEGDPDAPEIPTPRSYAEAIEGPYSSEWQAAMDAEMASWKSTGTYVDEVPSPGANIVSGMWIFRVKRPPCSPPAFKARYVARGFSQRQGVDFFHTFSPTPKMTTLWVLLHVAAQRDYELHSLDFSTVFLQGSLHEEIWLFRPPGFTRSFPAGTQWSLRRPVYALRQAPREWHDTLRTTLAALGFPPSTSDPSLFLRTDTTLPPFYVLVYVDDLVFATADTESLAHVNSELQKRHTCTGLGELTSYLGLRITRDRARRTITLTQSHMVQQVLLCFSFTYSSPQSTPLPTGHSLSAPPSDESVEPSGPYPELVGYLITSGMGLVLGGRARVVLTGHADASWFDDLATQRSSQGYTFSLSSSCEAGCRNMPLNFTLDTGAMAAQELRWLTYLLTDLGEAPRSPPVLYVDNKAMLALCQEHRLEHRTKHISLRYFLARELQQRGQLRLAYVASQANTADVFTKALQPCDHQRFACFAFLD